jgi:hypothetical protein
MKRRSFIKGLVALALAPVAALSKEDSSPANELDHFHNKGEGYPEPGYAAYTIPNCDSPFKDGKTIIRGEPIRINTTKPNRNGDMFVMPERGELETYTPGLQDTEVNEELFELGRAAPFGITIEQGCAILDNRKALLMEI